MVDPERVSDLLFVDGLVDPIFGGDLFANEHHRVNLCRNELVAEAPVAWDEGPVPLFQDEVGE